METSVMITESEKERLKKTRRRCCDRIWKEENDSLVLSVAKLLGVDDETIDLCKRAKSYIIPLIIYPIIYLLDYAILNIPD